MGSKDGRCGLFCWLLVFYVVRRQLEEFFYNEKREACIILFLLSDE
jgi:hypothetical protein